MVEALLHFPGARFVTVSAAGKRANGADVDAHAAFFANEMIAAIGDDDGIGAAHTNAERFDVHAFIADAYATETENAARGVVINEVRPFFFGAMNLFFDEAAGVGAVSEDHILQFALATLIADRAIERVIRSRNSIMYLRALRTCSVLVRSGACLQQRPRCRRFGASAPFRLRPDTCDRQPATRGPGNDGRRRALRCRSPRVSLDSLSTGQHVDIAVVNF